MASGRSALIDQLIITTNPKDYRYVSQGVVTVDNMDDKAEFDFTDVSRIFTISLETLVIRQ